MQARVPGEERSALRHAHPEEHCTLRSSSTSPEARGTHGHDTAPRRGVRAQGTLVPLHTRSSPARVVGLVTRQHLHHHASYLRVVGDIPEPISAQDQNVVRAVLVLREVVNPDLASNGARRKVRGRGGSRCTGCTTDLVTPTGSGH